MEHRQWKGSTRMIDSVDRIVRTPMRECPFLVEGILGEDARGILVTRHFEIDPQGDDWFRVTDTDSGVSMLSRGDAMVLWLQPQDMNDPVVQAELMLGLREMGLDL